jgi:hypothetical protein
VDGINGSNKDDELPILFTTWNNGVASSRAVYMDSDKSFYFMLARAEWLQRRLNKAPLWAQKRRERIFKKLVGYFYRHASRNLRVLGCLDKSKGRTSVSLGRNSRENPWDAISKASTEDRPKGLLGRVIYICS